MSFPIPENKKDSDGELTLNESKFILDTTLKPKHRTDVKLISFIDSFIRCKSISQASEESGVHQTLGYRWRHLKDVSNAIQKLIDKSTIKHGFDSSEILERVKEAVDFDPIDLQNPDGTWKDSLHDIAPATRRCITEIKAQNLYNQVEDLNGIKSNIIVGKVIHYKWDKKAKYAEMVGKEKQMFTTTTRVEHDVTKNMASVLLESAKLADKAIADFSNVEVIEVVDAKESDK